MARKSPLQEKVVKIKNVGTETLANICFMFVFDTYSFQVISSISNQCVCGGHTYCNPLPPPRRHCAKEKAAAAGYGTHRNHNKQESWPIEKNSMLVSQAGAEVKFSGCNFHHSYSTFQNAPWHRFLAQNYQSHQLMILLFWVDGADQGLGLFRGEHGSVGLVQWSKFLFEGLC